MAEVHASEGLAVAAGPPINVIDVGVTVIGVGYTLLVREQLIPHLKKSISYTTTLDGPVSTLVYTTPSSLVIYLCLNISLASSG
jgi:hypothetical protein